MIQELQVEIGVGNNFKTCSTATFILAESWPACSFAAKSLQHHTLCTYVEGMTLKSKSILATTEVGWLLISGPDILSKFGYSQGTDECWIQGSTNFVERMVVLLSHTKGLGVMHMILSDSPRNGCLRSPPLTSQFQWTALSHVQVGGVLKGSLKIGHSKGWDYWDRLKHQSNVTPGVRDILDTTLSGHDVDPSTASDDIITHLHMVPCANIAVVQVLAPSVFSSTGWCTRSSGADEIMNAFDVRDFAVQKKLKNQYQPSDLPFLAQPPAKVIFRAMDCAKPVSICWCRRYWVGGHPQGCTIRGSQAPPHAVGAITTNGPKIISIQLYSCLWLE